MNLRPGIKIDIDRLVSELDTLAEFSDSQPPAITRIVYSEMDRRARAWLRDLCVAAELDVREDPVGNLFARWHGTDSASGAIGTGSHIDAIPHSGRFDGTVGVLGGLEAIRALKRAGFEPRQSIELLVFISEEPTRFGIGCLGSRMLAGNLIAEAACQLVDRDGKRLDEVRSAAGYSGDLKRVRLQAGYYRSFLELHIEQGTRLEAGGISLGIVTGIAAPAALRVAIKGQGGHAGAVLMRERRDALSGAAEIVLAVEQAALATGAPDTVATTGVCEVSPGAVNSIPSMVKLELDIRDVEPGRRDGVLASVMTACAAIGTKRGLQVTTELLNADAPAKCAPRLVETLSGICHSEEKSFLQMISRAYHDSLFMSRIAPTAMLFIPCKGGVSHRPDEYAAPRDIENGALVLARALAALSSES